MRAGRWAAVAAAFAVVPAPSAWAAVAAPNGRAGAACTDGDPCDIRGALRAVGRSGEVVLRAGTYDLRGTPTVEVEGAIWIHGPIGGPRPVLVGDGGRGVVRLADRAAVLEHVEVEPTGSGRRGIEATSGVARDIVVRASGTGAAACQLVNGMVVSSVCWASGNGGNGVLVDASGADAAGVVVSSTVVGQTAVRATSGSGHSGTVAIDSSILLGGLGGHDIATSGTGAQRVITSYSSFDDVVGPGLESLGGDQRAAPLLADPAAGDFRQRAGSPTIDAGSPVDNIDHGRFDIDGDPRRAGVRIDIGADEFGPPRVDGPSGDDGDDKGAGAGGQRDQRASSRSGKPARLSRLRVVVTGSAARSSRRARRVRALFRLDRAAGVRLTVIRIGRFSDEKTSLVVKGKRGPNAIALAGRLGRATRRSGTYVLQARTNGGRTSSTRFRIGSGPERFGSAG